MNNFTDILPSDRKAYNKNVNHPLQSYEWGEFREKTGIRVIRRGEKSGTTITNGYTMTLHKIPKFPYFIGYLPKGPLPTPELLEDIRQQAMKNKCVYVQLEPDVISETGRVEIDQMVLESHGKIKPSFHPLFTKHTFVLDLTPSEEVLLSHMHPKTRYNIRVATKRGVAIVEDDSEKGFNEFLRLYEETTTRQKFYAHTPTYHRNLWKVLGEKNNDLTYHLVHAKFDGKTLASWVLFSFHDTLYYPYGASSREHRETMASNLIMWESILLGKKMKLKKFDMWGALGSEPDPKDPWFGFHKFKQGYGATLTEYIGSYDLVINPTLYEAVKLADGLRWKLLSLKKRF